MQVRKKLRKKYEIRITNNERAAVNNNSGAISTESQVLR
jgi:hypothetical protein